MAQPQPQPPPAPPAPSPADQLAFHMRIRAEAEALIEARLKVEVYKVDENQVRDIIWAVEAISEAINRLVDPTFADLLLRIARGPHPDIPPAPSGPPEKPAPPGPLESAAPTGPKE